MRLNTTNCNPMRAPASLPKHLCKFLHARLGVGDDEFGVNSIHWQRTNNHDLPNKSCVALSIRDRYAASKGVSMSKSCAASAGCTARAFRPTSHRAPPISFGCQRSRRPSRPRRVQRAPRACRSLRKSNDLAEGPIPTRMWPTNGKHRVICEVVDSSFYAPRRCPVPV